jgi:hypothetical protein
MSTAGFPVLRVLGGILLIISGFLYYEQVSLGAYFFLLMVFAGVVVILVALSGHRPRAGDIAIFVIGVLAVGGATAGYYPTTQGSNVIVSTYSASTAQVRSDSVALTVTTTTGSVSISFLDKGNLAYEVNFTRPLVIPAPWTGPNTVTNSTSNGVFSLNVAASASSVSVYLGHGYNVSVNVTADAGSISLNAGGNESVRSVSLSAGTGSIDATVDTDVLTSLNMRASTGSVNLVSNHLAAAGPRVPVSLSSTVGSVEVRLNTAENTAVSINATATLGSISHDLVGLTVSTDTRNSLVASSASIGTASRSLLVSVMTVVGSADVNVHA